MFKDGLRTQQPSVLKERHKSNQLTQSKTFRENMNMSVTDFISTGLKYQENVRRPKFGVRGYQVQDTGDYEPLYKISNIANCTLKSKIRTNYLDNYVKLTKWTPAAKYNVTKDWTKGHLGQTDK